jgi:hypothetical protein
MGDEPARLPSNLRAIRLFGGEGSCGLTVPRVALRQCLEKPAAICYLIAYRIIIIKYHSSSFGR